VTKGLLSIYGREKHEDYILLSRLGSEILNKEIFIDLRKTLFPEKLFFKGITAVIQCKLFFRKLKAN
jgi:hypothetical protein